MALLVPPINSWCLVFYECGFSSCFRDALQSLSHAFVQSLPASHDIFQADQMLSLREQSSLSHKHSF